MVDIPQGFFLHFRDGLECCFDLVYGGLVFLVHLRSWHLWVEELAVDNLPSAERDKRRDEEKKT